MGASEGRERSLWVKDKGILHYVQQKHKQKFFFSTLVKEEQQSIKTNLQTKKQK